MVVDAIASVVVVVGGRWEELVEEMVESASNGRLVVGFLLLDVTANFIVVLVTGFTVVVCGRAVVSTLELLELVTLGLMCDKMLGITLYT